MDTVLVNISDIEKNNELMNLLDEATNVYNKNFNGKTWYGRCIFISWYCSVGDCTFCFRTTQKHKIKHPKFSRRSMGSILLEALFSKLFNWRIEFITGGYGIMSNVDLLEVVKNVSFVYGEKVWVNLGALTNEQIELFRPYMKGICASMETLHPELHKEVCPSKPIEPYDKMFSKITGFKKSIAVIVGLGDTFDDMKYLFDFVEKHDLDRVTIYALKPITGGAYKEGPTTEQYITWIAKLRIRFPKLEIIAGTNFRRCDEINWLMKAGANAITKFPATKQFASKKAYEITQLIKDEKREFTSNLTELKNQDMGEIDWNYEIDKLNIKQDYKDQMKEKLQNYLNTFKKNHLKVEN